MAKRAKHVYQTGEIPHLWAHKVQESARNARGNLHFSGDTIFSYGCHFPIARHIEHKGRPAILFTTRGYSNTTSGHISAVRSAIPPDAVVFHVSNPVSAAYDSAAMKDYASGIVQNLKDAARGRSTWKIDYAYGRAVGLREEALRYSKYFGQKLPKDFPGVVKRENLASILTGLKKESAKTAAQTRIDRKIKRVMSFANVLAWRDGLLTDLDWQTRESTKYMPLEFREVWTAEHKENLIIRNADKLEAWQNGEDMQFPYGLAPDTVYNPEQLAIATARRRAALLKKHKDVVKTWRHGNYANLPRELTLLRMVREFDSSRKKHTGEWIIETSLGAVVPASHAKRALILVRAVVARGEVWETNGHTCHVGHYRIDRIEADGTIKAGCHTIPRSEWELLAPKLEKIQAAPETAEE